MVQDPNRLLYEKNPFVRKALNKRLSKTKQIKTYDDFLSWLRTPYGQDFLKDQVHIRGWLDTADGSKWLDSEAGINWRRTTQYGEEYQRLRSTREGRKALRNPLEYDIKHPHKNRQTSQSRLDNAVDIVTEPQKADTGILAKWLDISILDA